MANTNTAPRWQIWAALLAIYLIWGSTYLAIRFAIETIPPLTMAGIRFITAGTILYTWMRWRGGAPRPSLAHWRTTAIIGALLLFVGNGGVTWAEMTVPSGIAALLVATVPLWMTLVDWLRPGGVRPGNKVIMGVILGFAGVVLLIGPDNLMGNGDLNIVGAAVVIVAALGWAIGSIYSRHVSLPTSPLMTTAMEMLTGGVVLLLGGLLLGEGRQWQLDAVTTRSLLSFAYLVAFGSLVGFTAYVWLLRVTTAARVSTYAYVNPVVAVFLGWWLANEPLTARMLVATAVIIAGVVLINTFRPKPAARPSQPKIEATLIPATRPSEQQR